MIIIISERLQVICSLIDINNKVADIGCDHGYLGILAIDKGVKFLQAVDNKQGPLLQARKNLKKYHNQCEIVYTLASGLDTIDSNVDTVVISGMGGELIIEILSNKIELAKKMHHLIIQANNKLYELRKYLIDVGFLIKDEKIVYENGHYYEVIEANYTDIVEQLSEKDLYFGPILLKERNSLFIMKWKAKHRHIIEILAKMNDKNDKYNSLIAERAMIEEVIYEKSK